MSSLLRIRRAAAKDLLPLSLAALMCGVGCRSDEPIVTLGASPTSTGGRSGSNAGPSRQRPDGSDGIDKFDPNSKAKDGWKNATKPDSGSAHDAGTGSSVSGSLKIGSDLFLDSDPADPTELVAPNDSLTTAQRVGSPATVGGFLGLLGSGPDINDFYSMDLAADEVVALYIALPSDSSPPPDFDLELYDSSNAVVDSSTGTGRVEAVVAPSSGTFKVAVTAHPGSSGLYTLAIGASLSTFFAQGALRDKLSAAWPLVPGEALVKLRPGVEATHDPWSRLHVRPVSARGNALGYRRVTLGSAGGATVPYAAALYDPRTTIDAIKRLRTDSSVEYAEPNYVRTPHGAPPNDPLYSVQWHYPMISLVDAWDHSTGAGTTVAVLDCGIRTDHPDFVNADSSSQLLPGYDMIADPSSAGDGDGRDTDASDPGDHLLTNDSSWHGTHTSGTVAAATNNGIGCAGVAPKTKVLPVRVLGIGGGTLDDLVQGILYAADLSNDAGVSPEKRADVINMSLGGQGLSHATADAVQAARAVGTIVVASAGNDTADASTYSPAAEPGVVTVGAVDMTKALAWYSNFGRTIDVVAPGGDETVDLDGNGVTDGVMSLVEAAGGRRLYTTYQGTSMAAPHVSGIVALMKAANPALTPALFDSMLVGTAGVPPITEDLGPKGRDDSFGNGLLNANLAVLAALEASSTPVTSVPSLLLSPTTLDFGTLDTSLPLEVSNAGRGTLTLSSFQADQPWVSVTPATVGANTVAVDRSGLAPGVHSSNITVASNGGTGTVHVRLTVPSTNMVTGGDIGTLYVVAVDAQSNQSVAEADVNAAGGYAFRIANLPSGNYRIVAGTDIDNNGFIGDDGEAYGAFPLASEPQVVTVTGDAKDIVFPVSFLYGVQIQSVGSGARARVKRPGR